MNAIRPLHASGKVIIAIYAPATPDARDTPVTPDTPATPDTVCRNGGCYKCVIIVLQVPTYYTCVTPVLGVISVLQMCYKYNL